MPRMIDLIRASAVPANLMQSAARGALAVPSGEMIEILVHLANHNKVFSEQAKLTLAGWDAASSKAAAENPATPTEVLEYLVSPENLRPALLGALLENVSVTEEALCRLAVSASQELADGMLKSARVGRSGAVLDALASNPSLSGSQSATVEERLAALGSQAKAMVPAAPAAGETANDAAESASGDGGTDAELTAFLKEHAGEISAEAGKTFQPIGGVYEESSDVAAEPVAAQHVTGGAAAAAPAKAPANMKKTYLTPEEQRGSALQKISKLDITGRIQLAMKGTKEERSLLIRDGTKIVALAVLESPKISDGEVEKFASQKNVLEAVLRAIPLKRRFMKNYNVVKNLVFNPRTPIDLSLTLMKNLLVGDLKNLAGNKEVSDTVRKLALRAFRQKSDVGKRA
jgi:hypothetical protein